MAKDITRPETVQGAHEDDDGTGIYWFIDPNGHYEQVFVPHITRKRARRLARDLDAIDTQTLDAHRWVPEKVQDARSLVSSTCGGKCTDDIDCVDNACRCIRGRCRRK